MASETRTIQAACLCGAANHEVRLKSSDCPVKGYMCHCDSCRHMTGSLALTVIFLPMYYEPSQSLLKTLTPFVFSKRITQYFCTTCGSHMLARCIADGDDPNSQVTWDVTTGTLEQLEGNVDWQGHEHVQDTLDGGFADLLTSIDDKLLDRWPAHFGKGKPLDRGPDQHEQVPLYWTSPTRPKVQLSPSDKLHGKCKCGGVEFWVSRPSARSALAKKYWPELPPQDASDELPPQSETSFLCQNRTKWSAELCVCNSCRLASGMEVTFWMFAATVDMSLSEDGMKPFSFDFGTLKKYNSSPQRWRYFCGTCGATCFYDAEARAWFKDIAVGLLNAPEGARAESWIGWQTSQLGCRIDAVPRAKGLAVGIEKSLAAWGEQTARENLSGPPATPGAL